MVYEIRVYEAAETKADAMRERFRDQVIPRLSRLGIEVVGVFVAADDEDDSRLTYVTRSPDEATRSAGWAAFGADPEWKAIKAESERDGPLLKGQIISILKSYVPGLVLG